jgi:hypothetical protein
MTGAIESSTSVSQSGPLNGMRVGYDWRVNRYLGFGVGGGAVLTLLPSDLAARSLYDLADVVASIRPHERPDSFDSTCRLSPVKKARMPAIHFLRTISASSARPTRPNLSSYSMRCVTSVPPASETNV